MTVTDVLDAMLALYAKPGTWCRYGIARDAAGREVPADSPTAVAWSLEGALEHVIGDWEGDDHRTALLLGASEACGIDLAEFNGTVRRQDIVVVVLNEGRTNLTDRYSLRRLSGGPRNEAPQCGRPAPPAS